MRGSLSTPRITMQSYTLKRSPDNYRSVESSILDLLDLVAKNPERAGQVGAGLVVVGAAILILVAIFGP